MWYIEMPQDASRIIDRWIIIYSSNREASEDAHLYAWSCIITQVLCSHHCTQVLNNPYYNIQLYPVVITTILYEYSIVITILLHGFSIFMAILLHEYSEFITTLMHEYSVVNNTLVLSPFWSDHTPSSNSAFIPEG